MSNAIGFYEDSPQFAHHALSPFDVIRPPINSSGGPNFSVLSIDGGVTPPREGLRKKLAGVWRKWTYCQGGKQG